MLTKNIFFKNFQIRNRQKLIKFKILKILNSLIKENNQIILSLKDNYKNSYNKKLISKFKKINHVILIGMGGSILGAKAIYNFLDKKKRNFIFIDNYLNTKINIKSKKINLIISKSGNTLETISNFNAAIDNKKNSIFLTDDKKSYLMDLAKKLKSEVVHHNNFIGGRYSVLSEVGMLPAELMGFNPKKFRRFNALIRNKNFINLLVSNVSNLLTLIKLKKTNSIILNYDDSSTNLFNWYQQLIAESLGKKSKGLLPIVSTMPRDNHSLMQYYLDGVKNNFFTFFFVKNDSLKINNKGLIKSHNYLKNKNLNDISFAQHLATLKVFKKKDIPHRSFIIKNKSEETLGEIFNFFILETILLGKAMNINPYDQPSVELIKKETQKILN